MDKRLVLIEASDPFAEDAMPLLIAASCKPVRQTSPNLKVHKILYQIKLSKTASVPEMVQRIQAEAKKVMSRHRNRRIVFCAPNMPNKKYVQVVVKFSKGSEGLELTNNATAAVARIILSPFNVGKPIRHATHSSQTNVRATRLKHWPETPVRVETVDTALLRELAPPQFKEEELAEEPTASQRAFVLDRISNVHAIGDDLRDDATGQLDARKVRDLFAIKMPSIAKAAGITRQALDGNPLSQKAQPVLKLFERVARLRSHPQFTEPANLRKWFRRPLPLFSNHSAEDLFEAGKLDVVATKVDQMLTGDFGG
jgi:hypothetical protein